MEERKKGLEFLAGKNEKGDEGDLKLNQGKKERSTSHASAVSTREGKNSAGSRLVNDKRKKDRINAERPGKRCPALEGLKTVQGEDVPRSSGICRREKSPRDSPT